MKKKIVALGLISCLAAAQFWGVQAQAKTKVHRYYNATLNGDSEDSVMNWTAPLASIAKDDVRKKISARKDFDGDGRKEKLTIKNNAKQGAGKISLTVYVNGRKMDHLSKKNAELVQISAVTYKVKKIRFLIVKFAEDHYEAGGVAVYRWTGKDRLVKLATYYAKAFGHVEVKAGVEEGTGKKVLYLYRVNQFFDKGKRKWPAKFTKEYNTYKKTGVSINEVSYTWLKYKNGKLKETKTNAYYTLTTPHD